MGWRFDPIRSGGSRGRAMTDGVGRVLGIEELAVFEEVFPEVAHAVGVEVEAGQGGGGGVREVDDRDRTAYGRSLGEMLNPLMCI